MVQEADQPILVDRIEERLDIGVQYVVHLPVVQPNHESIQRIVLAALRAEPVREAEEIFLVNPVEHRDRRPLDDLVLNSSNSKRA